MVEEIVGIEKMFRDEWSNIFNIFEEENYEFNYEHKTKILTELNNITKIVTYPKADHEKLKHDETFHSLTLEKLIQIIKDTKQRAPVSFGLTKLNFFKAPESYLKF